MNETFFSDNVLLRSRTAAELYRGIRDLPIVDYHSHLNEREIAEDRTFSTITELWLGSDHYKWRAMRACGIEERRITGDAGDYEKFLAYASVMPMLCGNPLYYWTHMELKALFGIRLPLNAQTAPEIYARANEALGQLSVRRLLEKFRVEYIATTDDPASPLSHHGQYGGVRVCPTFRADRALRADGACLEALGAACGKRIETLADLRNALEQRLRFFLSKGCALADVSVEETPLVGVTEAEAEALFSRRGELEGLAARRLFSYGLAFLAELCRKYGIVLQMHIGALRNVNRPAYLALGADAGYDVMHGSVDTDGIAAFLGRLHAEGKLPKAILYTLEPGSLPALCTVAGSFPDVRVGAAWWFNDTLQGIRRHLETVSEYSVLGTSTGMLTDSRSFAGYCRFDFFRRILADAVAEKVDAGEYDRGGAAQLLYDICYANPKKFMKI